MTIKEDGFKNVVTGLNVKNYDNKKSDEFFYERIPDETLINITSSEGIGKKTVDKIAGDMIKRWINIKEDPQGLILDYLAELECKKRVYESLRWALGLGGGVLLMGINDGQELSEPVNINKIKEIMWLKVFNKTELFYYPQDINKDQMSMKYGMPETWTIQNASITQLKVHESRLMFFDGEPVTNDQRYSNLGWGDSIFQATYDDLRDLAVTWQYCPKIVKDFRKGILKMDNLFDMVQNGQESIIRDRIRILDLTSDMMNREVIDKELEEFKYETASVAGVIDFVTKMEMRYASVMGIPMSILYGQTPQGLNSSGKGEENVYYDNINAKQEHKMTEPLSKLIKYIMLAKEGPTKGKIIDGWDIEFKPLQQETQLEMLQSRKLQSEIDQTYVTQAVLSPDEVRDSRFAGNGYSYETSIEGDIEDAE